MSVAAILALLNTASTTIQQANALYTQIEDVITSEDQAQLDAALATLQRDNDAMFELVMGKLRDAATQ